MFKCFRVRSTWYDGFENQECYYYCFGYRRLGKLLQECINNEETILEIVEVVRTFKAIRVCLKNTCSWSKNKCV